MVKAGGVINRNRKSPIGKANLGNPYRAILRRDYPWLLNALMILVLGIWMYKHYFTEPIGWQTQWKVTDRF
jgi:hypothetical protein